MSKTDPAVSVVERIDALCDRFEAAWKSGRRPNLAGYLESTEAETRAAMLAALLSVEIELRAKAGEQATAAEYRGRFPELAKVVDQVFDEWHKRTAATVDTSVSGESVRAGNQAAKVAKPRRMPIPEKIGRFEVQALLGEGGFGKVYKARDPQLDRTVAIKVPQRGTLDTSEEAERFLREARAAANLHHPNLCPVHEIGEVDGSYFIVMAYVDGKSLATTLKERTTPLPAKQAALILRKLALALSAAHAKGIIHRDLKPSNIMIDRERKDVVIMDFGLARRRKQGDAKLTQEGAVMGTPAYMAPEQARGDIQAIGPASDIYGLGVILYEMLAGKVPFSGSVNEVIGKVLHVEPVAPSTQRDGVDPQLETICMKAIAKAPAERFVSMKALADALDGFLKGMPAAESGKPAKEPGSESGQLTKVAQALSAERREETRAAIEEAVRRARIPLWRWLAGAGFLATVIVAGIIFFARTPTATVLISIEGLDIKDTTLAFFLDKKNITGAELQRPIELNVGDHELVVLRGQEEVRRYRFVVLGGRDPGIQVTEMRPGPGDQKKASPSSPPDDQRKIVWQPLIRSSDELIEGDTTSKSTSNRIVRFRDGNLELHGANAAFRPKFTAKNYILRATILQFGGKNVMLSVRRQRGTFNGYGAWFNNADPALDWPAYGLGKHLVGKPWQDVRGTMQRVTYHFPVQFAISAFGNHLAVYANGERVVSHVDNDSAEGEVGISLTEDSHVVLRNVDVCVLDGTKLTPDDVFPQQIYAKKLETLKPEYLTAARKRGNLLRNGSFEDQDTSAWRIESWRSLKESCKIIADQGHDGSRVLEIRNTQSDDVSYKQTVKVKPITRYLLTGWLKTRDVQKREREYSGVRGAHLYVWGGHERKTSTLTLTNDWTYFAVIFHSGNRTSVDVAARLGYFAGDITGTAWFDDLCLIELPDSDTAESPQKAVVPITKTFFEDFSKTGEGDRPAGWNADDAVNVRKQGDRPRLEVTGKGLRYVSLPAVSLGKNFFLECEFIAASDGTFELTLQGHDGGRDLPISAVASGGFSVYGAALQKVRIPEVDPKASKSREKPEHRLRLEREGDIFRLKVDEETIHARRLPGYGGFSGVRLGLPGGDSPTTKFYWIKMGPLADSPRQEPAPADPDKAFRQGFRAEFQHAVEGDLPLGWKGDAAVAVRKGDDVRPRLEPAGKGPYSVTTPDVTIEGNFFLELELTVASGAVMEVTLEGRSGGPDLPLSFHGSGGYAGYGASLQQVRLAELEPKTSKTIKSPEHRLRLERQGDVFRLVIDGETIHAQRLPGFKGFARVRLRMANDAAPPTRLFGIRVSPLD